MIGRPEANEAAPYYSLYIDRITSDNVVSVLETQLAEITGFLRAISEEKSLYRYAADKWSMRQLLNHVNDTERVFLFRAFWFARGFPDELPSYDQNVAAAAANADEFSWASHIDDFRAVREGTLTFFAICPRTAGRAAVLPAAIELRCALSLTFSPDTSPITLRFSKKSI